MRIVFTFFQCSHNIIDRHQYTVASSSLGYIKGRIALIDKQCTVTSS